MTMMTKMMMSGAAFAALAAATPATAQYGYYGGFSNVTQVAADRCAAAVQNRLSYRNNSSIFGALLGVNNNGAGRVLSVTQVNPNRNMVRVRGIATSGRVAYNPYGMGAYGMLGANYAADLSFKCDVDYRGYIRDIDINRR